MRSRGFSLVELVTVTLIISIVAAVAVPKFASSSDRFDVEASARRVASALSYARRHAQSTGTNQLVTFDATNSLISIPGAPSIDHGNTVEVDLRDLGYKALFTTDFPDDEVTFSMHGTASNDGSVTISLGGYVATVSVFADSGRVIVSN